MIGKEWWQKNVVERKKKSIGETGGLMVSGITKPSRSDPMYDLYQRLEDARKKDKEYWE